MLFLPLDWTDLSPCLPITLGRELGAQKFDLGLKDNSAEKKCLSFKYKGLSSISSFDI